MWDAPARTTEPPTSAPIRCLYAVDAWLPIHRDRCGIGITALKGVPRQGRKAPRNRIVNPSNHVAFLVDLARLSRPKHLKLDGQLGTQLGAFVHVFPDPPHPVRLLRARRERPRGCTAEQRYERTPLHSITSSI